MKHDTDKQNDTDIQNPQCKGRIEDLNRLHTMR